MQLYKIVIAGEGGQGVQSIAKIIANSAFDQGKKAVYVPYFSTEKRGGTTEAYAQVGDTVPAYPKFAKADLWAVRSERAIERIYPYLKDDTKVIVNSFLVTDVSKIKNWDPLEINAGEIATKQLKKPRAFNMVIMGAMVKMIPGLDKAKFLEALKAQFKVKYEKDPELEAVNAKAFEIGYELA